jgi:tubulin polyglutamylase TTLL5
MQSLYGYRHFDFVPKTFVLPQEMPLLLEEEEREPRQYWIVKPSASCQGKGIFVTNNILDIPEKTQMIASKYICDPLLINGFKFDMRIYVVITSIDPLRLYVYEEGLVRLATCKYSAPMMNNKKNKFIHLTNYSINKHSSNFVANEDPFVEDFGSKWSLTALNDHLKANKVNTEALWGKIDEIIIKTILAIEPLIKSSCDMYVPYKDNCFELLGFDILLDSSLNPWLLEVNLSPSLNCDAPIDQKIKGELISDLFTLIGVVPMSEREQVNVKGGHFSSYKPSNTETKKTRVVKLKDSNNKDERIAIRDAEEEYKRKGKFRRIFPTPSYNHYKAFFESERLLNITLAHHLIKQTTDEIQAKKILAQRKVESRTKRIIRVTNIQT